MSTYYQERLAEIEAERVKKEADRLRARKEVADLGRMAAISFLVGALIVIGGIAWDGHVLTIVIGSFAILIGCFSGFVWAAETGLD